MLDLCVSVIEDQIQQFFDSQRKDALAESTKKMYMGVAKSKLIPFCKRNNIMRLDDTFQGYMEEYAQFLRDEGVTAHTAIEYLTVTQQFFSFHGYEVKHNYRIPRADKQAWDLKQEQRWFSEDEVAMCRTYTFRVNHLRNHLIVRLFSETGARINEIANIRLRDVDLHTKTMLLHHSKTIPRSIRLNAETTIFMRQHIKDTFPDPALSMNENIFPGKNMIYKVIMEMLNDLEIKQKGDGRGPHTFRHFVATYMRYVLRLDLDFVSKVLGDTSEMVTTRYIHPTPDMLGSFQNSVS